MKLLMGPTENAEKSGPQMGFEPTKMVQILSGAQIFPSSSVGSISNFIFYMYHSHNSYINLVETAS